MLMVQFISSSQLLFFSTVGLAARQQRDMDLLRRLRLEMLLRQWCAVEAMCIKCSRKRTQGNMTGNVTMSGGAVPRPANVTALLKGASRARRQGITALTDDGTQLLEKGGGSHIYFPVQTVSGSMIF